MAILDFCHSQVLAGLAVDHHWDPGVACLSRVIGWVGLLDIRDFFFVGAVADRREVTVAFVDGVVFGGNGRVYIPFQLLNVRHRY